jgi:hypothetical protein
MGQSTILDRGVISEIAPQKWLRGRDLNPRSGSCRIMILTVALSRSFCRSRCRGLGV